MQFAHYYVGMNIRWDFFVGQYDTARFVAGGDARDNRHVQFVREFASVVSVLQASPYNYSKMPNIDTLLGQDKQCH